MSKSRKKGITLVELHDVMGDRVNKTLNENLTQEEREIENEQTKLIIGIAKQMINNGKLILEYEKALAQTRTLKHSILEGMIGEQLEED